MSSKRNITYKCPYCDKRFNKENLVIHVGDKHDDMIPQGYSAFRVVFDYVNKKPAGYNGKCIICGKESGWDEGKGKYNRLCNNPECKKKYVKQFEDRMMKSKGVTRISSTADGQAKMLANRKISGEYKFQDSGIKTYTGTYEKKALEFMDKVMNIKSEDITTPGPILEYMFEGKKHMYISDIYYAPYNLIIEVKDGGNNPNNRNMPEYRAKQIAKEKWIIKNTDFNYLRLTNNDFSQLLAAFMELKMEMSNDTPDRVIRINEGIISNRLQYPYKYGEAKKINKELADKINSTDYPWYFINITELINSGVDINLYGFDEEPIEGVNNSKYKRYHLYNKKVKTFHGRDSLNPSLRKYSKFNKGAAKTKDIVLKEDYIEESNNELSFKSDKDLLEWMKKNISYSNFTKLKSHDEVLKSKKGSCHDQVMFEYEELKKLGYSPKGLFIIELDKNGQGGMTHSLVYYKKGDKVCWFEHAWEGQKGIGEHNSLKDIKDIIKDMYNNYGWGNIRKYGKLEFKSFSIAAHKSGESLQQFVDICLGSNNESYIEEACTGEFNKVEDNPEIIETYGFKNSQNIYNVNVKIKGFNKWLRGRSELLILKGDKIYLKKDSKKGYSIPGGGWDENEDHNLAAIRETNEEARIKVKNVNYVSSYVAYFPPKDWVKKYISEENWWYGEYIELYIGEYDGQFKGEIDDIDKSDYMASGKFYDIKSIYKDLIPVHQEALSDIINEASISNYKFLDIKSNKSKALEYLKANSETKSYAEDTIKNYNGELVIYNDTMIGRILVGDKKDKGFITDFSIDEEHRGNKLGSKLIDDAINKYHGVDLLVDKDNELAIGIYKRRGFVIVKTYKNQYYMKLESKVKEDTRMTEAMNALMTGYIPGSVDNPNNTYIVNYMQNNVFSGEDPNEGIAISDNPKLTNLIIRDNDGILKRVDESFLDDKTYKVYIIELSKEEVSNRLSKYMGESVEEGFIYETLTGHKLYTKDQIQFESNLQPVVSYNEYMKAFKEICDNYFQAKDKTSVELSKNFIPKEVRFTNNSGLMSSKKVYNLNEYINAKSDTNILECLDISIK